MSFFVLPIKYAYLAAALLFFIPWLFIYLRLPRHRLAMIVLGLGAVWIGLLAEYLWWTYDWWHPLTITGTRLGIEDIIMCFTHLGIGLFAYKALFNTESDGRFSFDYFLIYKGFLRFSRWFIISFGTTFIIFYLAHLSSFWATIVGMAVAASYVFLKRPDLSHAMILTSLITFLIGLLVYSSLIPFSQGYIQKLWDLKNLSGIFLLGVPIEDLIWYALLGLFLGGGYEYLFKFKLIDARQGK